MKRYTVNFGANYGMFVDEHGEWVTFSDHEAELARVTAERDAAVQVALFEGTGDDGWAAVAALQEERVRVHAEVALVLRGLVAGDTVFLEDRRDLGGKERGAGCFGGGRRSEGHAEEFTQTGGHVLNTASMAGLATSVACFLCLAQYAVLRPLDGVFAVAAPVIVKDIGFELLVLKYEDGDIADLCD